MLLTVTYDKNNHDNRLKSVSRLIQADVSSHINTDNNHDNRHKSISRLIQAGVCAHPVRHSLCVAEIHNQILHTGRARQKHNIMLYFFMVHVRSH